MAIDTKMLERALLNAGMTGKSLAMAAGLSTMVVSKYRNGHVKKVNPVTLKKMADVLKMQPTDLLIE